MSRKKKDRLEIPDKIEIKLQLKEISKEEREKNRSTAYDYIV